MGVLGAQIGQFLHRQAQEELRRFRVAMDMSADLILLIDRASMRYVDVNDAARYKRKFAVMFVDLDRFKIINDTLGHEAGDKLLQEIALRFSACLRTSDVVARLDRDDFVILVQEVSINLSARQLTDENLLTDIIAALKDSGLRPELLAGLARGVCEFHAATKRRGVNAATSTRMPPRIVRPQASRCAQLQTKIPRACILRCKPAGIRQ